MARNRQEFLFNTLFGDGFLYRPRGTLVSIVLLLAWLLPLGAGAEVFKWVDDEGNVHYGDSAPPEHDVETIRTPPPPSDAAVTQSLNRLEGLREEVDEREKKRREEKERQETTAREGEARKQRCSQAQRQLAVLDMPRIFQLNGQGQKVYLEDDQRAAKLERARKEVKANCR